MSAPRGSRAMGVALGALLALPFASAPAGEVQGRHVAYPAVVPGRALEFPRDFGAHPDFRTEWWYATAGSSRRTARPSVSRSPSSARGPTCRRTVLARSRRGSSSSPTPLCRTRHGAACGTSSASRERPTASTTRYKTVALVLSAVLAGLAGAFYTSYMGYIDPKVVFALHDISVMAIMVVMVGGVATRWGPAVGAVIMILLAELIRTIPKIGTAHHTLYGILLIVVIIFLPNGIVGDAAKLRRLLRPARGGGALPRGAP